MALPVTFATLPAGNNPASLIDTQFAAVAAMGTIYGTALGSNALTLTPTPNQPTVSAYSAGMTIAWIQPTTNTGAVTVSVSGLGAVNLTTYKTSTGVTALLTGGELPGGQLVLATFDGTQFQANGLWGPQVLPLTGGTVTGTLTVSSVPGANFVLDSPAGTNRLIWGRTSGSNRWQLMLGNSIGESGSNAGSDLSVIRFNDAGASIDTPLTITRSNGNVTITKSGAGGQLNINKPASGQENYIFGQTNGSNRWRITMGDGTGEGGSNAGSNWSLVNYNDAGGIIAVPMSCTRSSSVCSFAVAIVNGPSDRSLKENIAPLEGALDKVLRLRGVSFNMIGDEDKRRHIGLVAQDVAPVVPEIIQQFNTTDAEGKSAEPKLALDYPKLTALLIEALKEAVGRIEALEARLAPRGPSNG